MSFKRVTATPTEDCVLVLSNGDFFIGKGIGAKGRTEGEICFNTGLTGYQETLTDPSYSGQIITFTFPHIGNVGANVEDEEHTKPFCKGLVIRESITSPSNFRSEQSLDQWLTTHNIVGISGVDTRALTRNIRIKGARHSVIMNVNAGEVLDIEALHESIKHKPNLAGQELAGGVSTSSEYAWNEHTFELGQNTYKKQEKADLKVVAIDYGIKANILRLLVDEGFETIVVSSTASFEEIMSHNPDGVFLSNGPGDPSETGKFAIPVIQKLVQANVPIFGICLGHQLLGLATGFQAEKMHQGHRGANQPVKDLKTSQVFITSQNHGFCLKHSSKPNEVDVTHVSLFDQSIEGIELKNYPAFSVQFHPESSPGPHDTQALFTKFRNMILTHQNKRSATHA